MPTAADTTEDAPVLARNAEGLGPDTAVVPVDEIDGPNSAVLAT
jgi:hypothetical protein